MPQVFLKTSAELEDAEVDALVSFLNEDEALNLELTGSVAPVPITRTEFLCIGQAWQEKHQGIIYGICIPEPVGTISISRGAQERQGHIGYWLASQEWGKGIATQAFRLALAQAREMGLCEVSAHIQPGNAASLRLWQKHGATLQTLEDGKILVSLKLAQP